METRIIVADNARARIFAAHTALGRLEEMECLAHPEAHWSNRDLASDAGGRSVDGHGVLASATEPKRHEAERFAHQLATHLKALHDRHHFDNLVLVAPPRFLGLLRQQLPKPLGSLVSRTVDKDLTGCSAEQIVDCIRR